MKRPGMPQVVTDKYIRVKSIGIQWVKAFFHPKTLDYRREKRKITDLSDSIWVIRDISS